MSRFTMPIDVFTKLRNTYTDEIILAFLTILSVAVVVAILLYGIKNYLTIIKIKKNKISFNEVRWVLIEMKPVWAGWEKGPKTIAGREGVVEWNDKKIYKQQEIKSFASEEDLEAYAVEYKKNNQKICIRIDRKNPRLYYMDFPSQLMMTGSGKIAEESILFITRIQNIFCRPTIQDWLIFPMLLPSSFGALLIFFWLASLDWLQKNEYIFLFALWLWLIILSIILIRGIYTDE